MSLRLKLIVITLLVGLVPLAISAWTTLALHQRALEERTAELHRKAASYGASAARTHLERTRTSLTQAVQAIAWDTLSAPEREGALWLVFKGAEEHAVVSLLDDTGRGVGPSAYLTPDAPEAAALPRHPRAGLALLSAFSARIPFGPARAQDAWAAGEVFTGEGMAAPLLPVAVPVDGPGGGRWMVAAAVSLAPLCSAVVAVSARGATAYLLDAERRVLCRPGDAPGLLPAEPALLQALDAAPAAPATDDGTAPLVHFRGAGGEERIAAVARTAAGWQVVVEQPAAVAFAANARMRDQTLGWLALALAVAAAAGVLLSRQVLHPVRKLLESARLMAEGRFEHRLPVEARDELGELSRAFNHMGAEVQARDREIRTFNDELQQRVEQRTRELHEAQEQLLHSQKMAAVASLGAGFAHELNNPLTSVLGLTQVLLQRARERGEGEGMEARALQSVEAEAHRIRRVVKTLLTVSQNYGGGEDFTELGVHELLDDSIVLVQQKLTEAQVQVVRRYEGGAPRIRGNPAQLRQAFINLFNNARAAMAGTGGTLTVSTALVGRNAVRIEVADTGRGIPPEHLPKVFDPFFTTKDEWRSEGLGLTVTSRVLEQHKGRIQLHSELGRGTTATLTLPAATGGSHLA